MTRGRTEHDLRLWGHRGAPAELPENTLASFRRALERGANALELDVHLTADGVVVVIHDPAGWRVARVPRQVRECTLREVRRWDVGHGYVAPSRNGRPAPYRRPHVGCGFGVPTLDELLEEFPDVPLSVDLKAPGRAVREAVLRLIARHEAARRVTVASFHTPTIRAVRASGYPGPTALARREALLLLGLPRLLAARAVSGAVGAQVPARQGPFVFATPGLLAKAHALGLRVDFWSIDDPAEAERLWAMGADGIMSNDPAAVAPALGAAQRARGGW